MLCYATVGSNDLHRAIDFYTAWLGGMGITEMARHASGGMIYQKDGQIAFGVLAPYDGQPATAGNGTMLCFRVESRAAVDRMHALAQALGGADAGAPCPRGGEGSSFYAGYCRDLDGNKLGLYYWED